MFDQQELKQYTESHFDEAMELLRTLGKIPAPSHKEGKRARFCREWLEQQGARDIYVDEAQNVVCRTSGKDPETVVVVMAHMDVVFPDETDRKSTRLNSSHMA